MSTTGPAGSHLPSLRTAKTLKNASFTFLLSRRADSGAAERDRGRYRSWIAVTVFPLERNGSHTCGGSDGADRNPFPVTFLSLDVRLIDSGDSRLALNLGGDAYLIRTSGRVGVERSS
jgi:hypothetical protein